MVQIAPVTLQYNPKTLWFDPNGLDLHEGDSVIVKTERGTEFGYTGDIMEVSEESVKRIPALKPVLRVATDADRQRAEELRRKGEAALPVFKQLAAQTNADMRPVMVEYLFDGDKAVFFFEAEERIDFRELVRKLASEFHVRVDMRQIGVRDEARLVGGLGHCGQELCCRRLGGEFCPVSIRMAKEQDLSLNPQKISGMCGRLMCCLRYEYDAYKEFKARAPKVNAKISTPEGTAKVVELDVPRENVKVRLEDGGKNVTFPLSAMDPAPEGSNRPNSIGDAFEEYANPDPFAGVAVASLFDTAGFTREDKLGTPKAHHNPKSPSKGEGEQKGSGSRQRRRRRSKSVSSGSANAHGTSQAAPSSRKEGEGARKGQGKQQAKRGGQSQRQRHGKGGAPAAESTAKGSQQQGSKQQKRTGARPGQKSSSLRSPQGKPALQGSSSQEQGSSAAAQANQPSHRRSRRRSHKTGGNNGSEQ